MVRTAVGKRIDKADAKVDQKDRTVIRASLQSLTPGIYIVEWRALTADTHRTEGAFIFRIGRMMSVSSQPKGGDVDEPLIWVRAIHFAATMSTSGTIFFRVFVAEPVFHATVEGKLVSAARSWLALIEWSSLAVALASGAVWLLFLAALMVEMSWAEAISEGHVRMVLVDTDFGHAWNLRLLLGALLGGCLFLRRPGLVARLIECVLAACFTSRVWHGPAMQPELRALTGRSTSRATACTSSSPRHGLEGSCRSFIFSEPPTDAPMRTPSRSLVRR